MTMLTKEALAEIEQRHKAATVGIWQAVDNTTLNGEWWIETQHPDDEIGEVSIAGFRRGCGEAEDIGTNEADAMFTAYAHQDIPALLAHIAELDARVTFHDELVETAKQTMEKLIASEAAHVETRRLAEAMAVAAEQGGCELCGCLDDDIHLPDCPIAVYRAHVAGEG